MSVKSKEEKFKEIASELIIKKIRFNLLNLLSDVCVNITEYPELSTKGETSEFFEQIKFFVRELYDTIINPERNNFFQKIENFKKDILKTIQALSTCNALCVFIFKLVSDEKALTDFYNNKETKNLTFDYQKIMMDCLDFINYSSEDEKFNVDINEVEIKRKQSLVLSCLPLKMTKQKYNDFLENSLRYMISGEKEKHSVINEFESLKRSFAPFKEDFLGDKFIDISNFLLKCWEKDYSKLSSEELKSDIYALMDTGKNIEEILSFLNSLYNDINYIVNILYFSADEEDLFQNDLLLKDFYFSVRNIIDSKDNEVIIDELLDRIYKDIEITKLDCDSLSNNFLDMLEFIDEDDIPEELKPYIETLFIFDKSFFMTPELDSSLYYDSVDDSEDKLTEEQFLNKKIDEFIEFTKDSLSKFTNNFAKKIKANFLEEIFYPFDNKEFEDYIKFMFSDLGNSDKDLLVAFHINRIFQMENFYLEDNSKVSDDFDICDENCNCGHHHHNHNHNHY